MSDDLERAMENLGKAFSPKSLSTVSHEYSLFLNEPGGGSLWWRWEIPYWLARHDPDAGRRIALIVRDALRAEGFAFKVQVSATMTDEVD